MRGSRNISRGRCGKVHRTPLLGGAGGGLFMAGDQKIYLWQFGRLATFDRINFFIRGGVTFNEI
jgi:hypothetical protein